MGYRGDNLSSSPGTNPSTLTANDSAPVIDVNANQASPNFFSAGGVTEFEIANPVVALQGSATADAPYLVVHLNATNRSNINFSFNARDIDGSVNDAIMPIAVQYRTSSTGSWHNLPSAFIADASTGPSHATLVTPVSVTLPSDANNAATLQVRVITSDAVGSDEWIGIDDIVVTSVPLHGELSISDQTVVEGNAGNTAISFTVTRAGGTAGAVQADYSITLGDTDASDFGVAPIGGTVSFADGETSKTITLQVAGDTAVEADEHFTVILSNPAGGVTITDGSGAGTITNDDLALVANADSLMIDEDATSANLVSTLLGNDQGAGTLTVTGVDTGATLGTVSFNAGTQTLTYAADAAAFDNLRPGEHYVDSFQYSITDANGLTRTATASVTVSGIADPGIVVDGNNSVDTLVGTAGDDIINGFAGNDVLDGGDGHDVIDGGLGNDTANYGFATSAVMVDLALQGSEQNTVGAGRDTLISIENLTGSAFNDILSGDANANIFIGNAGDDVIDGRGGIDTAWYAGSDSAVTVSLALQGTAQDTGGAGIDLLTNIENLTGSLFDDVLTGDDGDNVIDGGAAGRDVLEGGLGNDILIGGSGLDTASYGYAAGGVTVDLSLSGPQTVRAGDTDQLIGIEIVTGSAYDDRLTGNAGLNYLYGLVGDDVIAGAGSNDYLDGGDGTDTIDYSVGTGIRLDLSVMAAQFVGASAGTDTVRDFENVIGSALLDKITGNAVANHLEGRAGDDTLDGGAGVDTLDGGDGSDTVLFATATAGLTVDLVAGTASDGSETDSLISIENATGTAFADTLLGTAGANRLTGGAGDDLIDGGLGDDVLDGGAGIDTLSFAGAAASVTVDLGLLTAQDTGVGVDMIRGFEKLVGSAQGDQLTGSALDNDIQGGDGDDLIDGGGRNDTLHGGLGADTLLGGVGNDALHGDDGDDVLNGGAGSDVIDGGAGSDTASYAGSAGRVQVDLAITTAQNTIGQGYDTLSGIEKLIGSAYDDRLSGDAGDNVITGGAGADTLTGRAGADRFVYEAGGDSSVAVALGADLITDFTLDDILDLSRVDANADLAGDDAFVLVGAFSGAKGEAMLTYDAAVGRTTFAADLDGDGLGDFGLLFTGDVTSLTANIIL